MIDPEATKETAKAVQEVAKTTSNAIDAVREIAGFVARIVAGPLEQGMGIFEDKLKYIRLINQLNFKAKAEARFRELGLTAVLRPVPLKIAVPLFQAASLEDDDSLQDYWASLLVNCANASSGVEVRRPYIDILQNLTPFDAKILQAIYRRQPGDALEDGILTKGLPQAALGAPVLSQEGVNDLPSEEVILSPSNMDRLGIVIIETGVIGGKIYSKVRPTYLGKAFFQACTLKKIAAESKL